MDSAGRQDQRGLQGFVRPMLASSGTRPPDGSGAWAYEMKWDGQRAIAAIDAGRVQLWARSGRDITTAYPELQQMAGALQVSRAMLDGEIVAFAGAAWPSFEALQPRMHVSSPAQAARLAAELPATYLAFDLLSLDGQPLLDQPYTRRRALLDGLGLHGSHWQTPPSFTDATGAEVLAVSREHGLEGVIAKRKASRYESGRRSSSWIKIKNVRRQEAVVGGWNPGEGGRTGQIGSLLIGVHGQGGLQYAGHVGTGFTGQTLTMLGQRLAPLRRATSPFATPVPREHARAAIWAEPQLVIEVQFALWTSAGVMRAAAYKGLRDDKEPAEVVREP